LYFSPSEYITSDRSMQVGDGPQVHHLRNSLKQVGQLGTCCWKGEVVISNWWEVDWGIWKGAVAMMDRCNGSAGLGG
jgi:hypothetical protein